jgi:energy-coupling factor transporter ATP-binding protein EcfA2
MTVPQALLPLLCIEGLRTLRGGTIDLDVSRGECICILGKSGSGKSVFLRLVADLDPGEGSVTLDGTGRNAWSGPEWRRRVIYQAAEPAWWAATVAEHFPADTLDRLSNWLPEAGLADDVLRTPTSRACRRASASAWRCCAPSRASRRCCCSTSRQPRSTMPPRLPSKPAAARSGGGPFDRDGDALARTGRAHRPPLFRNDRRRPAPRMNTIHLDATDLVLATLLVLLNAGASLMLHLRLHRQVLWAATRMVVQLLLVGFVLRFVFAAASPAATLTIVFLMILAAAREVAVRPARRLQRGGNFRIGAAAVGCRAWRRWCWHS